MLQSIYLKNFALFEEEEIHLGQGMTALIGESGSGKSLVLDALSSLLGGRCSSSNIRQGQDRYLLQAVFHIGANPDAQAWLTEKGFAWENQEISVSKELQKDGKSRIFIGESLASLAHLRELGSLLCEIHNQNEQLFLLDKANQLEFIDRFAHLSQIKDEMKSSYSLFRNTKKKLEEWEARAESRKTRMENLRFQIQEWEALGYQDGEWDELSEEEKILSHSERLFGSFRILADHLYEGENSVLQNFSPILASAEKIAQIHSRFSVTSQELVSVYEQIRELRTTIREEEESISFAPERLDTVQNRLKELSRIKKKWSKDLEDIAKEYESWKKELESLEESEESIDSLRSEYQSLLGKIKSLALELSKKRQTGMVGLEGELQKELEFLGMKGARLQIALRWEEDPDGDVKDGEKHYILTPTGLDHAEFLFSANAGEKPRPLRKIASGGEMSRIMLAVRTVLGRTYCPDKLLVFDEIDSGVGGEGAIAMAKRLGELSTQSQILVITHSQAIAGGAQHHCKVEKILKGERTVSRARTIADPDKPMELARMIAGKDVTRAAVEHAKEILLKKAV